MNRQQPDNFFRQKLHNYQKTVPQGAWNKIESALEKKTQPKFVWWKVAAVFFLIAGAAYVLWFNNTDTNQQQPLARVENKPTQIPEKSELVKPEKPVEDQMIRAGEKKEPEAIRPQQSAKRVPRPINEQVESPVAPDSHPVFAKEDDTMPELLSHKTGSHTVEISETQVKSTITLTFSSEETSQYLNKNALAEATSNEKKPSSLKKFLKKANDLKSNQDPFGDLRERKNEILALNFKNDKRGQNK